MTPTPDKRQELSDCHKAPMTIGGDDDEGTHYYVCTSCSEVCDRWGQEDYPAEFKQLSKLIPDYESEVTPSKQDLIEQLTHLGLITVGKDHLMRLDYQKLADFILSLKPPNSKELESPPLDTEELEKQITESDEGDELGLDLRILYTYGYNRGYRDSSEKLGCDSGHGKDSAVAETYAAITQHTQVAVEEAVIRAQLYELEYAERVGLKYPGHFMVRKAELEGYLEQLEQRKAKS